MGIKKYSIGVDFGTLSGRALLIEVDTGIELATAVKEYTHGVMDKFLPDGVTPLKHDWALQYPRDYIEVLEETIPAVLKKANVNADDVIGLGIDFTASTIIPIDKEGTPLCYHDKYKTNPHSYVKLWKHHTAQDEANLLNKIAKERGEEFLQRYGGKISSEWLIPKVWQILNEAPEIYEASDRIMELADWIILQLTGEEKRNICTAGYKAIWHKQKKYPSKEFLEALDPRLENLVNEKLSTDIYSLGSKAGGLTLEAAKLTGLNISTPVAVGNVDAHVSVPAVGITEPGKMLMIIGTSTCDILLGEKEANVPGMCGVVEDGVMPGYYGYEAGQSGVGDHFKWFIENCIPCSYHQEAKEKNCDLYSLLNEKASQLKVGESGLIALDWWNGNRSVLVDTDLTGLILGCTLSTKPEEIYRALIEAIAFGQKMIIETFKENGVPINELYAAGGIAEKSELMMQIYADVNNMKIKIAASPQTPAFGSAMFGAVAAGKNRGGYDTITDAAKIIGKVKDKYYRPIPENVLVYNQLYTEYKKLHDYFGRGENNVMKRLKKLRNEE